MLVKVLPFLGKCSLQSYCQNTYPKQTKIISFKNGKMANY
jgi:hypothetical protein